jgi:hypothetical protein
MLSLAPSFWTVRGGRNTNSLMLDIASSQYVEYGGTFGDFTVAGTQLTIEQWVKHTTSTGTMTYQNAPNAWRAFRAADNTLRIRVDNGAGGYDEVGWNVNPPVGVWQHYAWTWDGSLTVATGSLKFYVNGVDQGAPPNLINVNNIVGLGAVTAAFDFGAVNSLGYTDFFDGLSDEMRIWTTVRTQGEIDVAYNREIDPTTPGLRNYYQWNGGVFTDVAGGLNLGGVNGASFSTDVPFATSPNTPLVPSENGFYLPDTIAESTLIGGTLDHLYRMQGSATPIADQAGTINMTISAGVAFQQTVAGWNRYLMQPALGSTQSMQFANPFDVTTTSGVVMCAFQIATTGASRDFCSIASSTGCTVRWDNAGRLVLVVNGVSYVGVIDYRGTGPHLFALIWDIRGPYCYVQTDQETITATAVAIPTNLATKRFGFFSLTNSDEYYAWSGVAVAANAESLIDAAGGPIGVYTV